MTLNLCLEVSDAGWRAINELSQRHEVPVLRVAEIGLTVGVLTIERNPELFDALLAGVAAKKEVAHEG